MPHNLTKQILRNAEDADAEISTSKAKSAIRKSRTKRHEDKLKTGRDNMDTAQQGNNTINQECGSNNWLTTFPIKEFGYDLIKEQFWDALRKRFTWSIPSLPTECACGGS